MIWWCPCWLLSLVVHSEHELTYNMTLPFTTWTSFDTTWSCTNAPGGTGRIGFESCANKPSSRCLAHARGQPTLRRHVLHLDRLKSHTTNRHPSIPLSRPNLDPRLTPQRRKSQSILDLCGHQSRRNAGSHDVDS
jgi:hypothetical protein